MSDEEELDALRKKRLEQFKQQAVQQKIAEEQQKSFEDKKFALMRKIISPEGRQRLENIRMVKPQFAEQIELQLIQLYQAGRLAGAIPLPDEAFKKLLEQFAALNKKKDFKIKY